MDVTMSAEESPIPIRGKNEVETIGQRHLLQLLSHYAQICPTRIYASSPIDPDNLSAGFKDISYGEFVNAINHCARWLAVRLPSPLTPLETAAYTGPKDVRYPIIACAFAKLERKLLLPSPTSTPYAQAHLVRETGCRAFLYGGSFRRVVESVVKEVSEWEVPIIKVPEVSEWLKDEKAEEWTWNKTFEQVKDVPWFIVHTSGTTGLPKPVLYTHQMMTSFDAMRLMPESKGDSFEKLVGRRRWYTPLPALHMVGMFVSLQFTTFLDAIAVFGPPDNTSPAQIKDVFRFGKCQATVLPPLLMDALAADPLGLEALKGLDLVVFGGAPLSRLTAEKLLPLVRIVPGFGSTEAGFYAKVLTGDDWEYHTFREGTGITFEQIEEDMHELVFERKPEFARWQQVFMVYPNLDTFRTGDLWVESKSRPGAWKVVGRRDDLIVFSHGRKMNALVVEMELSRCPGVAGVVVGGEGRPRPFVLVEWANDGDDRDTRLSQLWPAIEKANERCAELVRVAKALVLFTTPEKKLARNVKGGPIRRASEQLFQAEIEELYAVESAGW